MVVAVVLVATAAIVKYKMLIQNRATTTFNNTYNVRQQVAGQLKVLLRSNAAHSLSVKC